MQKFTFPNGLRLVVEPTSAESVTMLVLVGAGSRYEGLEISGISHFCEHMFFKGAKKYSDAKAVSEAVDSVGGEFNAFTGKEYAGYFVKLAGKNLPVAVSVLSDMLRFAAFSPEEIEKERGVILEEFNMYLDTPMYQVGWDFERLLFGDQPLGRDQIGTRELIRSVTHEQFAAYHRELYTPDNTVITIAGKVDLESARALIEANFGDWVGKKAYDFLPFIEPKLERRIRLQEKKTEQGHLVLGARGVSALSSDYFASKVLAMLLGGMMSSRMFLSVREAQGLCYSIATSTDDYLDTGAISTHAGVELSRIDRAVEAIVAEYEKMATERAPDAEVEKAKECLKGKIVLRLEDTEEIAHFYGKQELLYPHQKPISQVLAEIDAVRSDDLHRLSADFFRRENLHLALIGPFGDRIDALEKIIS